MMSAGIMRHIVSLAGIDTVFKGFVGGLGLGIFIAAPWIATNHSFSMKPRNLMLFGERYVATGSAIIGTILTIF